MSFEDRFNARFENVIKPAIEENEIGGRKLKAYRVDLSRSGESILTEISNGIAHCFLFLADVSTIDHLRFSDKPARNSNVLYEVGIALACRTSEEVLLVRDDSDPLIFDTSSVPHITIDFEDQKKAKEEIQSLLEDRAKERKIIEDARVLSSLSHLSPGDLDLLMGLFKLAPSQSTDLRRYIGENKMLSIPTANALGNLLRLDLAIGHAITEDRSLTYKLTDIGRAVADRFQKLVQKKKENDENKTR
ncbi:MAG: hypothetical protein PVG66_03565 [Chromatiales bacterium]|jgi:hypothetical protein